jgi:hypothetical protein
MLKATLRTITNVKLPNNTLKNELRVIDGRQNRFFLSVSYDEYEQWRALTIDASHAIIKVKDALDVAKKTDSQYAWSLAYQKAIQADDAVKALLAYKFRKFFSSKESSFSFLFITFMSAAIIPELSRFIVRYYQLNTDDVEELSAFFVFLIMLPNIICTLVITPEQREQLEKLLVESSWCAHISEKAQEANIKIDLTITTNKPWSNAQLLDDIGCEEVDEAFNCEISYTPMTNPVYDPRHKARYDKPNIDLWLFKQNKNPSTQDELYWDELVPDEVLEKRINHFTHDKVKKYIKHTTMTSMLDKILEQHEMASEDEHAMQLNQQWRM